MNIGIITFHRAENFGAVLQAYALQTYLSSLGHEVKIVDYRCVAIEQMYDVINPRILGSRKNVLISARLYLERFGNLKERYVKKARFEDFRNKYLCLTESVAMVCEDMGFDVYITGSDQVWNLHLTHGLDEAYFLSFPMKVKAKKIAYAASSEDDPKGLLWKNKDVISDMLNDFASISVREEFLKKDIARYVDKPIHVCVDPTLLLNREAYYQVLKVPEVAEKYILIYHMTPTGEGVSLANRISQTYGYRVIEIFGGYTKSKDDGRYKCDLGPSEILGYISRAEVVITTSFHGLALSLIFNKAFWIMAHSGNYRQRNLLSLLGLENRLVYNAAECDIDAKIDYTKVNTQLSIAVEESKQFLNNSLS